MSRAPGLTASLSSSSSTPAPPRNVPGTWAAPPAWARAASAAPSAPAPPHGSAGAKKPRRYTRPSGRSATEDVLVDRAAKRVADRLAEDQQATLSPDVDAPFADAEDAVRRLLPYHVWQHPKEDLETMIRGGKGKGKATEEDILREEISETKQALECFKRKRALEANFRRIRIKSGKHASPSDAAYVLASAVLEAERAEVTSLKTELANARTQLDQLERVRRAQAASTAPATPRPAIAINTAVAPLHFPAFALYQAQATPTSAATSRAPPTPVSFPAGAPAGAGVPPAGFIPVQLPLASLPELTALGILPVAAAALAPAQAPLAILRGLVDNRMMNLEINAAVLKQNQREGLTRLLSSIMSAAQTPASATGQAEVTQGLKTQVQASVSKT